MEFGDGLRLYMNKRTPQRDLSAHDHNFVEIAFVTRGSASHYSVGGETKCRAGDVIIIPVGVWHAYNKTRGFGVINCLISPVALFEELSFLKHDALLGPLLGVSPRHLHARAQVIRFRRSSRAALQQELDMLQLAYRKSASPLMLLGRLLCVLDLIKARISDDEIQGKLRKEDQHPCVAAAIELINNKPEQDWTLEKLAEQVRLSPSYFVRLFHSQTGTPPMQFLLSRRSELAANLLLTTSMRIGEIGERVGWNDPNTFSRNFKAQFGQSASSYRKRMQKIWDAQA